MLTDEELMEIRNRAKLNDNRQIDPLPFARDVIKALLAKAIPKQEPVAVANGFRWRSRCNQIWDYVFDRAPDSWELREAEIEWVQVTTAQPAQAAAIPDNVKYIIQRLASELESEIEARHTEGMMIYPSIKSKYDADMSTVIEARALLSASPKPE